MCQLIQNLLQMVLLQSYVNDIVIPCTNIEEERIKVSNISACISFYQSALLQFKINKCAYRIQVSFRFKNPVENPVGNMLIPVINQSKYLNY